MFKYISNTGHGKNADLLKGDIATNLLKSGHPILATIIGICDFKNRYPKSPSVLKIGITGGVTLFGLKALATPVLTAANQLLATILQ